MVNTLKKFFISKKTLVICSVIAMVFWFSWGILCITKFGLYELLTDAILYVVLLSGVLIAYYKGETNIQKALLGALFLLLINSNIEIVWANIHGDPVVLAIDIISCILAILIFISHILLQSDHVGKKSYIFFNQCCGLMLIVLSFYGVRQLLSADGTILDITFIPAWVATYMDIICIETRVQEYKRIRAEAKANGTWNDETRAEAKKIFDI